ncbi:hypothetical protein [Sphingomonas kyeonggiensis]|uniref:Uncharacterized protein n=1 Tax=Sphingomonas kyeonggiensis TaxID=1268553 RepID=A0A7W6JP73_9SPHN|nr:hypothetical protein [Sphingomonas kyeonggiensis]MBB4096971.1 hypothetical protein [Sphingomonas kyeonggiensis]
MARFKFFLIGSTDAPVLDVEAIDLAELHALMSRERFIAGHMADPDTDGIFSGVLVPISRVQFVMEI